MADHAPDPVELYRASGLPEAHAICLLLDAEGIPARIENELLQGAVGDLPLGWATAPRIIVDRADESAARTVLQRVLSRTAGREDGNGGGLRCLACGAAMGEPDACPSCGWSYRADTNGRPDPDPAPSDEGKAHEGPAHEAGNAVGGTVSPAESPVCPAGPQGGSAWWEVAAVLAVGIVPNLIAAVSMRYHPTPPPPYWLDALQLVVLSGCTILVTLYLIGRSGVPWERFGIIRPGAWDVILAGGMFLVAEFVWRAMPDLSPPGAAPWAYPFPRPHGPAEHVLAALKYGAGAFAEELVTRAYLVTRLALLLRSRGEAVLVAAILFASYHTYQDIEGVLYSLVFGLVYGAAFLAIGRVWPLALGHALYNVRVELLVG